MAALRYLQDEVGDVLVGALADLTRANPDDPVDYLGKYLKKCGETLKEQEAKVQEQATLHEFLSEST